MEAAEMKDSHTAAFPIEEIRREIGALHSSDVAPDALLYFDNAATTFLPKRVIEAWIRFHECCGGSPDRGQHSVARQATERREQARNIVKQFLGVGRAAELVFCSSATAALNMAAYGLSTMVEPGDVILVSELEHHSNFLPWQRLAKITGALFEVIPCQRDGSLDLAILDRLSDVRVKVVAVTHTSNVTGARPDVQALVAAVRSCGAVVVLDAAQAVGHERVDFDKLGVDLMAVSAHKMYAPKGIGGLVGRGDVLARFEPIILGGGAVRTVGLDRFVTSEVPRGLEPGTQDAAAAVAWAAACRWLDCLGVEQVAKHERLLGQQLRAGLSLIPGLVMLPSGESQCGSITSFVLQGVHSHDLDHRLSARGVAIRTGNMCAQPLLRSLGYYSVNRVSFGVYNTHTEVDRFLDTLAEIKAE